MTTEKIASRLSTMDADITYLTDELARSERRQGEEWYTDRVNELRYLLVKRDQLAAALAGSLAL